MYVCIATVRHMLIKCIVQCSVGVEGQVSDAKCKQSFQRVCQFITKFLVTSSVPGYTAIVDAFGLDSASLWVDKLTGFAWVQIIHKGLINSQKIVNR